MRKKRSTVLTLLLLLAVLSCSQNRCSPTSPEETVAPFEIVYHHSDEKTPALDDKLHAINVETGAYRVLGEIAADSPMVWRKDLGEIFYMHQSAANRFELRASASEGNTPPRVVATLPFLAQSLSFAPDGAYLAVAGASRGFYLVNAKQGDTVRVGTNTVKYAAFSPSSTKDELVQLVEGSPLVFLVNRVGEVVIPNPYDLKFEADRLAWAPDGQKLVCWKRPHENAALVKREDPVVIPLGNCGDLAWSPDGKEIVYSDLHTNLGKMDAKGNNKTLMGTTGLGAQWSPDGKRLAFCEEMSGALWLFLSDAKGSNRKALTLLQSRSFTWRPL